MKVAGSEYLAPQKLVNDVPVKLLQQHGSFLGCMMLHVVMRKNDTLRVFLQIRKEVKVALSNWLYRGWSKLLQ